MYRKWNKRCPKLFGSQLHIWTKPSYPSRLCPMENCSVPKQQNMMIREGLQTPVYLRLRRINGSADRTTSSPVSTSTNTNVPHVAWLERRFRSVQLLLTGSYQVFAPGRSAYVSLQILAARDDVLQRSLERVRTHKLIFSPRKPFLLILNVEVTSCGCCESFQSHVTQWECEPSHFTVFKHLKQAVQLPLTCRLRTFSDLFSSPTVSAVWIQHVNKLPWESNRSWKCVGHRDPWTWNVIVVWQTGKKRSWENSPMWRHGALLNNTGWKHVSDVPDFNTLTHT